MDKHLTITLANAIPIYIIFLSSTKFILSMNRAQIIDISTGHKLYIWKTKSK